MKKILIFLMGVSFFCFSFMFAFCEDVDCGILDLNVAIFAYLPDASTAIERIEEEFEKKYPFIDLDLELWDPYADEIEEDGLKQIDRFDIVEIDLCRIDQLIDGAFGGLDLLPYDLRPHPQDYVGGAKTVLFTQIADYVIPHWVCGLSLIVWSTNQEVIQATSFEEFLDAVDPAAGRPLLAAMWGSTGLGEFYADAMIDIYGQEMARNHLLLLSQQTEPNISLDPEAVEAVERLVAELEPINRENLSHFYYHSYVFPRQFANNLQAVLFGYSERLYYTERELQITPGNYPPVLDLDSLVVRQFSFSAQSKGTPSWVDGFVIPKGKLRRKKFAIRAFLRFIQSDGAYLVFAEPAQYFAPTYLLPATLSAYGNAEILEKQPLLPKFYETLDESFPIAQYQLWQGIRAAGSGLKDIIQPN